MTQIFNVGPTKLVFLTKNQSIQDISKKGVCGYIDMRIAISSVISCLPLVAISCFCQLLPYCPYFSYFEYKFLLIECKSH